MKPRLLAASATLAATALLNLGAQAAIPSTAAGRALGYLATQQQADGSIDHALGETADYALGAKFHGLDPNNLKAGSLKSVYDYLASWVGGSVACAPQGNARDGNTIGKLVQAVVAGGHDPTAFGGRNLLADLEGPAGATGGAYSATTGAFQDCASGGANAVYAQANAIMGLQVAANPTYPVSPAAIQFLRASQGSSGGWSTFGSDNSNAAAMALMALGNRLQTYCGAPADATLTKALAYLHTEQDPASGGFAYHSAFGTTSDPDSDGLVIQALAAVQQDPAGAAWTNTKGNPAGDILTFQDISTGGFKFDHTAGTTADAFTTSEVPGGLDRAPFPDGSAHFIAVTCPLAASPSPLAAATPQLPRAGSVPKPPGGASGALLILAALAGVTLAMLAARVQLPGMARDG